jgi:glycosyltransferase involved in cell wall biosynthesis
MSFPRVLVVVMSRINAADTANNGLLLRNIFGGWPKEKLAQIYSSGGNGDKGFFGRYYQLGPLDRRRGSLFYKLKADIQNETAARHYESASTITVPNRVFSLKCILKRLLVDTGVYELLFRPRLSKEMLAWVKDFKPDIIFAQGYNLTFTWLPVMLKEHTKARMAFLTTDDWPTYLYSGQLGEPRIFSSLLRGVVKRATHRLMSAVDVPFAFGQPMADEYTARYGKRFISLSHFDDPQRYEDAIPQRTNPPGISTILAMGYFNKFRWPLLLDANECCRRLSDQGINARISVLLSGIDPEGARELAKASHIDILDDPGNDLLPGYLKGADVLLLAEGFDESFVAAIRLSVSTKSHLFMFSRRPIIVYAHPDTGVAKYASMHRWGRVIAERDIQALSAAIRDILSDADEASRLVAHAKNTANAFHLREVIQVQLLNTLTGYFAGERPNQ